MIPYPSNTTISAYAGLHGGPFDFAAYPIAPACTKIVIHDKLDTRASWAPHGSHGHYLGPAQAHYRCHRVWATATRSIRVTDTIAWFFQGLQLPSPLAHGLLCAVLSDLTEAVQNLHTPESSVSTHPTGNILHTLGNPYVRIRNDTPCTRTEGANHAQQTRSSSTTRTRSMRDPLTVPNNTLNTSSSHTDTQSNTLQKITPSLLEAVTTTKTVMAA